MILREGLKIVAAIVGSRYRVLIIVRDTEDISVVRGLDAVKYWIAHLAWRFGIPVRIPRAVSINAKHSKVQTVNSSRNSRQ